ncbi:MAG: hypothetical protein JXR19_10565 [Bacteroidia bacterium]
MKLYNSLSKIAIIVVIITSLSLWLFAKPVIKKYKNTDTLINRIGVKFYDLNTVSVDVKNELSLSKVSIKEGGKLVFSNGELQSKIGHLHGLMDFEIRYDGMPVARAGHFRRNNWYANDYYFTVFKNDGVIMAENKILGPDSTYKGYLINLLEDAERSDSSGKFLLLNRNFESFDSIAGRVVDQKSWSDKEGTWFSILTETVDIPNETAVFRMYKIRESDEDGLVIHDIYHDSLSCGDADIVAKIDSGDILITDLNKDSMAEMIIVYTLSCTYDISPQKRVLAMNIGNLWHTLEGFTLDYISDVPASDDLDLSNYKQNENGHWTSSQMAGRYINEDSFIDQPVEYIDFARTVWIDILKRDHELMLKSN